MDAQPEGIGGVEDHVHLLFSLKPTACLCDLVRELKKASSVWVRERQAGFQWQEGYAAFTVSASARDAVRQYIARQEDHHRRKSFTEELVAFFEKSGTAYDPRFLE